jgi:phosphoadenosine phosphosulfate reductase
VLGGEFYFDFDKPRSKAHIHFIMLEKTPPSLAEMSLALSEPPLDLMHEAAALTDAMTVLSPPERLALLRRELKGRIVFTHGFGIEGQLLFHWIAEQDLDIDVVTIDTGRLFPETYDLWRDTEARYGRRIHAIHPDSVAVERLVARDGLYGFYESVDARHACCDVRKIKPLAIALAGAQAWLTGVRADQTDTRHAAGLADFEKSRGIIKVNPLLDWTRARVLEEVAAHDVPINALHARGFASIGCEPCTRAIKPGEPERNGRWWWEQNGSRECGLHLPRPAG